MVNKGEGMGFKGVGKGLKQEGYGGRFRDGVMFENSSESSDAPRPLVWSVILV